MQKDLQYRDVDFLIEKLKQQNLIIDDEDSARVALEQYGYSNLIKSYRDPYVYTDSNGCKKYRDGISFEQICSLYIFDKNLRNAVMSSMLDYEELIKVFAAHTVAEHFGSHQDDYLKFSNYRDRKNKKNQFSLSAILTKMNKTLNTSKDPIHHYKSKYGVVPPWILFKSVYMGTIVNFIDLFKKVERETMAKYLYPDNLPLAPSELQRFMLDTMFMANEFRNLAAHGSRIYDHKFWYRPQVTGSITKQLFSADGISRLLFCLGLLKNRSAFDTLSNALNEEINRHCSDYPQDATYLSNILQVNIKSVSYVYVTGKSKKYHLDPRCSGMRDALRIEKADAIASGFVPCARCANTYKH